MAISDIRSTPQPPRPKKGTECGVCNFLRTATPADSADLLALLQDRTVRYTWLSEQLAEQGVEISSFMLGWHSRGRCSARVKLR